jgi:hypothetical protein
MSRMPKASRLQIIRPKESRKPKKRLMRSFKLPGRRRRQPPR